MTQANHVKTNRLAILITSLLAFGATLVSAQTPATTSAPTPAQPAAAPAAAPAEATTGSWVLTPSVVSQYMFRGVRLGGPSFQPSLEYDYGAFAIGVWNSDPIADRVPGQSNPEIDPYGSYTFTINDKLSIVPGFTWYTYPRADRSNGFYKDTFEPNLAVNYTIGILKITPKFYYDVVLRGPTYELNAAVAVPLKEAGTELDFAATVGTFKWDDSIDQVSPSIKNWGNYWLVGVSLPFQVTKASKLTVGFAYTKGSDNYLKQGTDPRVLNTAAVGRGVVTVSYGWTF